MAPQLPGTKTLEFLLNAPKDVLNLMGKQFSESLGLFQTQLNNFIKTLEVPPIAQMIPSFPFPTTPSPAIAPSPAVVTPPTTVSPVTATRVVTPATKVITPATTTKTETKKKGYGMR